MPHKRIELQQSCMGESMNQRIPAIALAVVIGTLAAGCSASQPAAAPSPSQASTSEPTNSPTPTTTPTPTPTATPTPSAAPGISDAGTITLTSQKGYTASIKYAVNVPDFSKSIANEDPGFTSITFNPTATATVTNTTSGRTNPSPYRWIPIALYPVDSRVCTLGAPLMLNPDLPSLKEAALPRFTTADAAPPKYCALWLADMMSSGSNSQLSPGASMQLSVPPIAGAPVGTIPRVPEASADELIAGLSKPAKIVYQVTSGGAEGEQPDQKPAGETCNGYFFADAQTNQHTVPFVIAVPAKYAGACS